MGFYSLQQEVLQQGVLQQEVLQQGVLHRGVWKGVVQQGWEFYNFYSKGARCSATGLERGSTAAGLILQQGGEGQGLQNLRMCSVSIFKHKI